MVVLFISRVLRRRPAHTELAGAHTCFSFAAGGIAFMLVIEAAAGGLMQRVREERLTGTLEALALRPVDAAQLAVGFAGFPFLFANTRACLPRGHCGIARARPHAPRALWCCSRRERR